MKSRFRNILIAYKNGNKSVSIKIKNIILSLDSSVNVLVRNHNHIKKEEISEKDLVITFGGDGTFIDLANRIEESYIIGINSSPKTSEGALTTLEVNSLDKMNRVLSGEYKVINRTRAEVTLNGKVLDELAVNEVYLGSKSQFHSSRYIINYKNFREEHRSSGIIVSTGTGSPAWFKSAGGKEFNPEDKKLSFIVREPYPGKKVFVPKLLGGEINSNEKLVVESTREFGGILAIGFKSYKFNKGDIATIELSDKPLKSIIL